MSGKTGRNFVCREPAQTARINSGRPNPRRPGARLRLAFSGVPARGFDAERALAAVNEQRAELGQPPWPGPVTARAVGEASLAAIAAAADGGKAPLRAIQRAAVRYTLGLLEQRAPGRSVEVRIPPFAAVQCVPGPRHTRGTPPNVVETDPMTWLELATGQVDWATALASGRIRASGQRADISGYLPLASAGPGNHMGH